MSLDQRVKIRGNSGWLRWSQRGDWTIHLEGFTDHESLEEKFLHPRSGEFDAAAIEEAKERLMERVKTHFKTKKEKK